jgi:hypothetical protein
MPGARRTPIDEAVVSIRWRIIRVRTQRFDGGDVKQRADFEMLRDPVIHNAHADQDVASSQHSQFGMTYVVRLPARHDDPERAERLLFQHVSNGSRIHSGLLLLSAPTGHGCKVQQRVATRESPLTG